MSENVSENVSENMVENSSKVENSSEENSVLQLWDIKTFAELSRRVEGYERYTTIENSSLPDYYKNIFPSKCKCGAEMIISRDFTRLQCCNPWCKVKQAHRLAEFVSGMGYKGFGIASAQKLVEETKSQWLVDSYMSVFLLSDSVIYSVLGDASGANFINIRDDLHSKQIDFADGLANAGVPGVGKNSAFLKNSIDADFMLGVMLHGATDKLCDMLGVNNPVIRVGLKTSALDIFMLESRVTQGFERGHKENVFVAITGSVAIDGVPLTREDFISKCQQVVATDKNGRKTSFKLVETRDRKKLQFVVADSYSSSAKFRIGKELGILVSGTEFYHTLLDWKG